MTVPFNDVGMTVTGTPGTGTITLGSAINTTYLTAAEAGVPTGTVVSYIIFDGTDIEGGIGTYTSAGTTLSRDTVTFSKIGGTAGTSKLTLTPAAEVRFTRLAADYISVSGSGTLSQFISVDSSGNLLFSTASTDRWRIDSSGRLIGGGQSTFPTNNGLGAANPHFQMHHGTQTNREMAMYRWENSGSGTFFIFSASRNATPGSHTAMAENDVIGRFTWCASDGTQFLPIAQIQGVVDGTVGTNDVPGRLSFFTTLDSGTTQTERLRISNFGDVCTAMAGAIATTATDGFLYVPTCAGTPTGVPTGFTGQVPIVVDTTNNKLYFRSGGAWRDAGP